jgi:hypothetical protein
LILRVDLHNPGIVLTRALFFHQTKGGNNDQISRLGLKAYPNKPAALKAMSAQAK